MHLVQKKFCRTIGRAWPLAGALVLAVSPAGAQDTTVVGSGGADSGVTVNMNVLNNGGGSTSRTTRQGTPRTTPQGSQRGGQQLQLTPPDQGRSGGTQGRTADDSRDIGDRGPGPLGRVLRFPPMEHPKSRLLVDPDAVAARRDQPSGQTQQASAPELREPGGNGGASQGNRAQDGQARGAASQTTQGQGQQPRESGMTAEGQAMAESAGVGADRESGRNRAADRDAGNAGTQSAASNADVPDDPAIPDAPSTTRDSGSQPDTITPDSKPSPSERDGGGTSMASDTGANSDQRTAQTAAETGQSGSMASTATGEGETATAAADQAQTADTQSSDTQTGDTQPGDAQTSDTQTADAQTGTGESAASDAGSADAEQTQTAKRTPAADGLPGKLQLDFETGSAKLSDSTRATLKDLAATLKENGDARIQLMAYAKGGDEGASRARRLSLSRALAVRSFLIDQGIRSTRMDVRALGDTAKAGPLDRVDIVPAGS